MMEKLLKDDSKEELIANFKVMIADAEALLKATAGQGGEKLTELREKTEASLKVVKDAMADAQDAVIARAKAAAKASDVYVHENPWEAIGIAAGVGFAIGWLIGRR
jgi:ElaB/YqjD/DUF883 family membrane-anchored ribosome-binding protein